METDQSNPLAKYFRRPGVHIKLPTNGRFFDEGELELSISGELAVYPMTAADEITLKNPDMLLNGDALERLFKSCVPGIKVPRKLSIPDMDVILLAIKLASYGEELPVAAECPKCKTKVELEVGIRPLLDNVSDVPESTDLRINDEVVLALRPYDFESKTILEMAAFEERQLYRFLVGNETMTELERGRKFNESFDRFANLNLDLIARCVISVNTPDGQVSEYEFIKEFIRNLDKKSVGKITETIKQLGDAGIDNSIELTCPSDECKHVWQTDLIFDPANFFD